MIPFAPDDPAAAASDVAAAVWRTTLDQPGYALLWFPHPVGSHELRRAMVALVEALPVRFVIERLGRFDQQVIPGFADSLC